MATQMTSARRGVATDEMKQIAKDEDVTLDWLIPKIASGSIIIPSNNVRKEKIHNVAIGKGTKTKVNVNIGTSTLNVNIEEEIEKAKVAVKYHADTIMDLSDGGDVGIVRRKLLEAAPITFGTVPIYEAYNFGVEKHKNPLDITEDDFLKAFENKVGWEVQNDDDIVKECVTRSKPCSQQGVWASKGSGKQDINIALTCKTHPTILNFSIRTNKSGMHHKLGQFINLAFKFNGVGK